jgi:hypothetical protein
MPLHSPWGATRTENIMIKARKFIGRHRRSLTVSAVSAGLLLATAAPSFAMYYNG